MNTPIPLDLTGLSVEDASALEQIFGAAVEKLVAVKDEAQDRVSNARVGFAWEAKASAEFVRAVELLNLARRLAARAHSHCLKANRERSMAIRAVEEMAILTKDLGRSPPLRSGSGCGPAASAAPLRSASSRSRIPNAALRHG